MTTTRYREARTLVRKLTRMQGEPTKEFSEKVRKLRNHFQQFNRDASQLCQWLMAIRPPEQEPGAVRKANEPQATHRVAEEVTGKRTPPSRNFELTEDTRAFWNFFMDPESNLASTANSNGQDREDKADKLRLAIMDHIVDNAPLPEIPEELAISVHAVKQHPRILHESTVPIFARLREIAPSHREVLLKAAAEWVNARYKRPMDRWPDQHKHWKEERDKWLNEHTELTEDVRQAFDGLFRKIGAEDKQPDDAKGKKKQVVGFENLGRLAVAVQPTDPYELERTKRAIRSRRPRICTLERMAGNLNNCEYAGDRCGDIHHGPLCIKYFQNFESYLKGKPNIKAAKDPGKAFDDAKRNFARLAVNYLGVRSETSARPVAMQRLKDQERTAVCHRASKNRDAKPRPPEQTAMRIQAETQKFESAWSFDKDWPEYLARIGVTEETAVRNFRDAGNQLPHCTDRKGAPNDKNRSECRFNPHTELCRIYKQAGSDLSDKRRAEIIPLEKAYREWRASYRSTPRRPQFNYPSAKKLPMPKIFGAGFWKANFGDATVTLTLETKEELTFGFEAWPKRSGKKPYNPQPPRDRVVSSFDKDIFTSVHVYFVGTRPRVGFRFEVEHAKGHVGVSQDDIDKLRSQQLPRAHQDKEFVREARKLVLDTFDGGKAEKELRVLSVDLGQVAAAYALFVGKDHKNQPQGSLPIAKFGKVLATSFPEIVKENGKKDHDYSAGLTKQHVVRHLDHAAKVAADVKKWRNEKFGEKDPRAQVGEHDQRGMFRHVNRMIRDWVRLNVNQIIDKAEELNADLIVLDSSRKPMVPGRDNPDLPQKQRKAYRAFGQIRHKLREKAVERGMRVVAVPEGESSKICHLCRQHFDQKDKKSRIFKCKNPECEISKRTDMDTEVNAALVLGRVFWGEIDPEQAKLDAEARKAAAKEKRTADQKNKSPERKRRESAHSRGASPKQPGASRSDAGRWKRNR